MHKNDSQALFEIVTTTAGAVSIRNNVVNETMHNPVGPWKEANELYIAQSRLAERLQKASVTLFDVGLGAAANSLAALHCQGQQTGLSTELTLISFERDLDLLKFALENAHHFEHFSGYETAIETLLEKGEWINPQLRTKWILRHGDFTKLIQKETYTADLIYFDPYSPKVNNEMWSLECLKNLRRACHRSKPKSDSHVGAEPATELYTYSQATPVRYRLLQAGFYVGVGSPTGLKADTTIASTRFENLSEPLGIRWADRL
ncbi:MAG: MnmC family methyltransferase, partial [Bdellovibrionota bacterium]